MPTNSIPDVCPFEANYLTIKGSKIHYLDEGKGDPILFLHGNPTSSYLWRNIIPYLKHKSRCIAPDLIGMGKSDQPDLDYGFFDSYTYLAEFIASLELKNITLVLHDWGSGLGFHYANEHRTNIKGLVFMESVYKTTAWKDLPLRFKVALRLMRSPFSGWLMISVANLFLKKVLPNGIVRTLGPAASKVYQQPYPTVKSRKPVRVWPQQIPINGQPPHIAAVVHAYHEWLKASKVPKLLLHANPGVMIRAEDVVWMEKHFPCLTSIAIGEGLHFVQEDQPQAIGEAIAAWYEKI